MGLIFIRTGQSALINLSFMAKGDIVIIEDEFFVSNHLRKIAKTMGFNVVGTYHSGEQFLKSTEWAFDAALVDIFLSEELTGINVATELKSHKKPFIFITANKEQQHITEAAKLTPEAYIIKPFKPIDVEIALQILDAKSPNKIKIKGSYGTEELSPGEIQYVKAEGSYIEIYTTEKKIVQRQMLGQLQQELPSSFLRVHRSYLVNQDFVDSKNSKFWVVNGHEVPISRGFKLDH